MANFTFLEPADNREIHDLVFGLPSPDGVPWYNLGLIDRAQTAQYYGLAAPEAAFTLGSAEVEIDAWYIGSPGFNDVGTITGYSYYGSISSIVLDEKFRIEPLAPLQSPFGAFIHWHIDLSADGQNAFDSFSGSSGDDVIFGELHWWKWYWSFAHLDGEQVIDPEGVIRGNDLIEAGGGNDIISPGYGTDIIDGGGGFDFYQAWFQKQDGPVPRTLGVYLPGQEFKIPAQTGVHVNLSDVSENIPAVVTSLNAPTWMKLGEWFPAIWYTPTLEAHSAVDSLQLVNEAADTINGVEGVIGSNYSDVIVAAGHTHDSFNGFGRGGVAYGEGGEDVLIATVGTAFLSGGDGNDLIIGSEGNDFASGDGQNDYIFGLGGDDRLWGGQGDDYLDGGEGWDTVHVLEQVANIQINIGPTDFLLSEWSPSLRELMQDFLGSSSFAANFTVPDFLPGHTLKESTGESDRVLNFEAVTSGDFFDFIVGNPTGGRLSGGGGEDILISTGGESELRGGVGNDFLVGSGAGDVIYGDENNDWIFGGGGTDTLHGGEGADRFIYTKSSDAPIADQLEEITDFEVGVDSVVLEGGFATPEPKSIGTLSFSGVAGQFQFLSEGDSHVIVGDFDGDAVADFSLRVSTALPIDYGKIKAESGLERGELAATEFVSNLKNTFLLTEQFIEFLDPRLAKEFWLSNIGKLLQTVEFVFVVDDIAEKLFSDLLASKDNFASSSKGAPDRTAYGNSVYDAHKSAHVDFIDRFAELGFETVAKPYVVLGALSLLTGGALVGTALLAATVGAAFVLDAVPQLSYDSTLKGLIREAAAAAFEFDNPRNEFLEGFVKSPVLEAIGGDGEEGGGQGDGNGDNGDGDAEEGGDPVLIRVTGNDLLIDVSSIAGIISGSLKNLNGLNIDGFSADDGILVEGAKFAREALSVTLGSAILEIYADLESGFDARITLQGDFNGGDFMTVVDDASTMITFGSYLPGLQERQKVDPELINGIINQSFLKGDGSTDFRVTLRDLGFAEYDNVVGVYEVDADGNIIDARILFQNANADKSAEATISDVEAGNRLGFFIVQDGADWASTLADDDTLSFVDSTGGLASVSDGRGISLAVNGVATDEMVFHSFAQEMNPDGFQHVLSGVDVGGKAISVGFEDLTGGGDLDYEDVVFRVELVDHFLLS